ncbi:hypothetical protein [Avibacterium paragallinarum]|uniref:Phage tail fibre repeat n=1 Tax=Avibacterium paragallinarum TaxID=728 RepID=A0A380X680_AVIPA|nr:hypothetical protein [Avibacterium paragallinarum]SUU98785.1 Phage tail fibre repeat [Avibacterium paragallinarum]
MSIANKPDEQIFASQAKRNEIDNFPDMLRGWGITFEQTEGIPPMEWFNFLFKRIDENLLYHLQRGLPEWSATLDYPKGAYVQHQGKTYRALMQNKNSPPNTADTDKWKRWAIDLDEINEFIRTNQKSSATNSESEDTVATSKAVYDLNGIKLDKVGGEAFLKTIDYTKANGYTYSGFYRPNGDRLNNLPLNGLMMHITHPHYSTNAHARGICFAYGSLTGNTAWDIFTTAFDANGNHLGQKRIMTELGGTFTGNVTAPNLTATGLINITGNRWERVRATLPDGGYWRWEVNPASKDDPRFNFMYRFANGDTRYVAFPRVDKNETVAYQGWVDEKIQSLITYQKIGNFQIRKYPDGTIIQTYTIRQNDLYEWFEKSFNWAIAFVDTPLIFSKVTTSIGGSHDADVNILTKSNNATCYYHEYEHGGSNQGNVRIQFLAIGRWK